MNPSLTASYKFGPIKDLSQLAVVLAIPVEELRRLRRRANDSYRIVGVPKKDGSIRSTFDANKHLKRLQGRINTRLLRAVSYPLYLQGGIRDLQNPRDYARNAAIHAGQACVINEDISDFYPSVTAAQVLDIWSGLFRFPPEVADALTDLTTRHGHLPQGAKTSSYLANLVFWRTEPAFVEHLHAQGLRYSRLADDITVSSSVSLSAERKSRIKSLIHSFMKQQGFKRKYSKQRIFSAGERMLVNNLVVNRRASLPYEDRAEVRSLVHAMVLRANDGQPPAAAELAHVRGKLGTLARFHPRAAAKLRTVLEASL